MSAIFQYLKSSIHRYISRDSCDVDQLRQEFASAYFYIRNHANDEVEANRFASSLVGPIAEFSGGYRSEDSLRLELAAAIRPFEARALPYLASHIAPAHSHRQPGTTANSGRLPRKPASPVSYVAPYRFVTTRATGR